jgi:hypothetical protein
MKNFLVLLYCHSFEPKMKHDWVFDKNFFINWHFESFLKLDLRQSVSVCRTLFPTGQVLQHVFFKLVEMIEINLSMNIANNIRLISDNILILFRMTFSKGVRSIKSYLFRFHIKFHERTNIWLPIWKANT